MGVSLEEAIEKIAAMTEERSKLVKKRHKHADVIIAWANGEAIEYKNLPDGKWYEIKYPEWGDDTEYRIKPKRVKKKGWVNINEDGVCFGTFSTEKYADSNAGPNRVACIRIEWEEEV